MCALYIFILRLDRFSMGTFQSNDQEGNIIITHFQLLRSPKDRTNTAEMIPNYSFLLVTPGTVKSQIT